MQGENTMVEQFSKLTICQFKGVIREEILRNPNKSLLQIVMKWRTDNNNSQAAINVINYASFVMEDRPGIGAKPIAFLAPFVI